MTPEQFKRLQDALGWTNAKMAKHLRKSAQSVSNYRNGRQTIPAHVQVMIDAALRTLRDAPPSRQAAQRPGVVRR